MAFSELAFFHSGPILNNISNLFMTIGENMNMTADDAGSVVLHSNIFIVSQIILRCQCKMF